MKKSYTQLVLCYMLWGFQPLYWSMLPELDSFTILGFRIVFAAVFSVAILAFQKRTAEIKTVFLDKNIMKFLVPAIFFLFGDWAIFIISVKTGHVLDASLGYYINPLVLFAFGIIIYKEKSSAAQKIALLIAFAGVMFSIIRYGRVPLISLVLACVWAIYATIKKNVLLDGILSIAVETIMLSVPAIFFLFFFRMSEIAAIDKSSWVLIIGSGIVTALPMYLYSNTVSQLPLIVMCFAQYLSPTLNAVCGFIMGESFSVDQLCSLIFFIVAVIVFTVAEVKKIRKSE